MDLCPTGTPCVDVVVTARQLKDLDLAYAAFKSHLPTWRHEQTEFFYGFELGASSFSRLSKLCRSSEPLFEQIAALLRGYLADVARDVPTFFPERLPRSCQSLLDDLLLFLSGRYGLFLHSTGSVSRDSPRLFSARSLSAFLALCAFVGVADRPRSLVERPPRQFVISNSDASDVSDQQS